MFLQFVNVTYNFFFFEKKLTFSIIYLKLCYSFVIILNILPYCNNNRKQTTIQINVFWCKWTTYTIKIKLLKKKFKYLPYYIRVKLQKKKLHKCKQIRSKFQWRSAFKLILRCRKMYVGFIFTSRQFDSIVHWSNEKNTSSQILIVNCTTYVFFFFTVNEMCTI